MRRFKQLSRADRLKLEALLKAGREDLIGYGPKCLLRPDQARGDGRAAHRDDNRRVEKSSAGR